MGRKSINGAEGGLHGVKCEGAKMCLGEGGRRTLLLKDLHHHFLELIGKIHFFLGVLLRGFLFGTLFCCSLRHMARKRVVDLGYEKEGMDQQQSLSWR